MAAKLIDLSFTLNGRKVKVQIAPDTMLFALLREQGCASVRCACETTNCGLCTVWLDGDPVLSCSVPAARVEGHTITTLEGLKAESEALARAMAAEGLPVEAWPSAANFVLVRTPHATRVRERLSDEYSILVRDFSYAPGLADCLRITVGTPQENDEVLAAFAVLVKEEI